jgi:hypothetical protein
MQQAALFDGQRNRTITDGAPSYACPGLSKGTIAKEKGLCGLDFATGARRAAP